MARDVALVLAYDQPQKAMARHCKYVKTLKGYETHLLTNSPRGINIIPESDVFRLVMRSKLPQAEAFQDWVCEEIEMDISSLLGGLGIGSILTMLVKSYIESKKILSQRYFEERRAAYINYLDIITKSQMMYSVEAMWLRTAATERIKLCGSKEVVRLLNIVSNTPPNSPDNTIEKLIQEMRNDLFPQEKEPNWFQKKIYNIGKE